MNPFLIPPAALFSSLVKIKNLAYAREWSRVQKLSVPVVSVGNLTVGGTGKTPVICELISALEKMQISTGVISRGYKSEVSGVAEVTLGSEVYFGDEPQLVKQRFPDVPIFVGAKRPEAGGQLLKTYPKTQLILADDAFQHRRLYRDLDVVVLDATRPKEDYLPLPLGRARESLLALARADVIVLSKLYVSGAFAPAQIYEWIEELVELKPEVIKVEAQIRLEKPKQIVSGAEIDDFTLRRKRWSLISALGNPQAFEASVKQELKLKILKHKVFSDHHKYVSEDFKGLLGADSRVLTTEKDAIKLRNLVAEEDPIYSTGMTFEFIKGKEDLFAKICRLVTPSS
jgi:tetraacyldisaccharide 4'-kinase